MKRNSIVKDKWNIVSRGSSGTPLGTIKNISKAKQNNGTDPESVSRQKQRLKEGKVVGWV